MSTLELLAPANIRSHALKTEVELQNQCPQLEKLKSTNSSLQEDRVQPGQKLNNHCDMNKEATKEVMGAKREALQDNFEAATAKNVVQEQSINVLKQEFANIKVIAAKKGEGIKK